MNRRAFLQILGGAITATAAKPVLALVPTTPSAIPAVIAVDRWWDEVNVMAFIIHSETFPENRDHYQRKAMKIVHDVRRRRAEAANR